MITAKAYNHPSLFWAIKVALYPVRDGEKDNEAELMITG